MENGTRRESLAHEYYKRYYARQAQGLGLRTTLEAARTRGRVDVLAEGHGVRLGIEIETGESDVISNVRNCLASGLRVVVVATGPKALETIESRLGGAGLLIPGRVLVVPAPREIPRSALNR